MMLSSAGVLPEAAKAIFSLPLNPTQFVALMSSCVSLDATLHVDSSINIVNVPAAFTRLEIVKAIALGVVIV